MFDERYRETRRLLTDTAVRAARAGIDLPPRDVVFAWLTDRYPQANAVTIGKMVAAVEQAVIERSTVCQQRKSL